MQQMTGVAVLATQLAQTDRRALSQAWYSALHLADHPAGATRASTRALSRSAPRQAVQPAARTLEASAGRPRCGDRAPSRAATPNAVCGGVPERRRARSELACRIERTLAHRTPRAGVASFAIRTAAGRIQLVVRVDGTCTRVLAVCAPPLRERVERALAHARFALAGRGVRTEVA
jgi:hypothetical protein